MPRSPAKPESWALLLDFDGTLVDIAERPEAVAVEKGLPEILLTLRERFGGALAIVSGRPISLIDRHLGRQAFDAIGLHGLERRIGGDFQGCRPEDYPALRAGIADLQRRFRADRRIVVEDKGCTVAVHWRQARERRHEARAAAETLALSLGPGYRVQAGKAVAEILPAAADKGRAIADILDHPSYRGRRAIFVGDDLTDEPGFETVNARGGVSVRIGAGETLAQGRLESPQALRQGLSRWAAGESFLVEKVARPGFLMRL